MNFPGNFDFIGNAETRELKQRVSELTEAQWDQFPVRHQRYEVHRHTRMIGLVYDPDFRHSHPTKLPALAAFEDVVRPVLEMTAEHYEGSEKGRELTRQFGLGYFIRATLVRLAAGQAIAAHQDLNFSLTHAHRVHLPIITNDAVRFTVGAETIHMREGDVYEINNRRVHSVVNEGAEDRVHLILDFVLPGEMCCCGIRHHPETLCSPRACLETVTLRVPCSCYPES